MSLTRATLFGGAAHLVYNTYTTHLIEDAKFEIVPAWKDIESSMFGVVDKVTDDALIKITGSGLTWDSSTTVAALLPFLTPVPGTFYPGASDLPAVLNSVNGDVYTAVNAVVTKMPDTTFGASGPFMGAFELTGIVGNGLEVDAANSLYTVAVGGSYTPVAIDKTKIPRGKYSWVWTGVTGMSATPFEFKAPPVLSWDLKLEPVTQQGRTRAFRLVSLQAMLKGMPIGPTASQLLTAAKLSGVSAATHGHRLSASASDLVGTGPVGATLKGASIQGAGFVFGNSAEALRIGEVGFVSTADTSSGTLGPVVVFS